MTRRSVSYGPAAGARALMARVARAAHRGALVGLLDRRGDRGRDRLASALGHPADPRAGRQSAAVLRAAAPVDARVRRRRGGDAGAVAAVRAAGDPGVLLGRVADLRPARRVRGGGRRGGRAVPDVLRAGDADVLARRPALGAGVGGVRAGVRARGAPAGGVARRVARAAALHAHLGPVPGGGDGHRVGADVAARRGRGRRRRAARRGAGGAVRAVAAVRALAGGAHGGAVGGAAVAAAAARLPGRAVRLPVAAAADRRRVLRAAPPAAGRSRRPGARRRGRDRRSRSRGCARRSSPRGPPATSRSCSGRCCSRWRRSSRAARAGPGSRSWASPWCG